MRTRARSRWVVFCGVVALLALTASAALAAPLIIYTRWVGDTGLDPRSPNGAFFSYCDFGTFGVPTEYHCVPSQKFFSVPDNTYSTPALPDPIAGIGSIDLNGDGQLDFLAYSGAGPGSPAQIIRAGSAERTSDPGTFKVNVPPSGFDAGATLQATPAVGFSVGQADTDAPQELLVAATNGTNFVVAVRTLATGALERNVSLAVPGMNIVSRAANADFLGFWASDVDGDGIVELLVLHRAPVGLDAALLDVFAIDGTPIRAVTLSQDPTGGPRPSPYNETYVGGFMRAPIVTNGPNELVVLRVDHRTAPPDPRSFPTMKYTLLRYDDDGGLIQSMDVLSVPIYAGAIAVGIAPLSADNNCNGIDEDADHVPDGQYQPKTTTCGVGACQVTTRSTCTGGHETPPPACVPDPPGFVGTATTCGVGACKVTVRSSCVNGVETMPTCQAAPPQSEILNGVDDDCNGQVDDIAVLSCAPNQQDWWCCPTGADVRIAVNTTVDSLAEAPASSACLPVGLAPPTAQCTLRGAIRRAEQLREITGVRRACRVVAELAAGDYQLSKGDGTSLLTFGGGELTLKGMGATPGDTILEPPAGSIGSQRILFAGNNLDEATSIQRGEHPPKLTVQNLTMRRGRSDTFGLRGGGAIAMFPNQPGAVLDIQSSIFDFNHAAQEGGAVQFWTNGTLNVTRSIFRNNESTAAQNSRGGALAVRFGMAHIEGSTFAGNLALNGAAICFDEATSTMLNNTVSQNASTGRGGGVMAVGGALTLRFNTIFANVMNTDQGEGGGIATFDTNLSAFGNIIAGNTFNPQSFDPAVSPDCAIKNTMSGITTSAGSNLIGAGGNNTDCSLLGAAGTLIGTKAAPLSARLDALPAPRGPNDPFVCSQAGPNLGQTCIPVCNGLVAAKCINSPIILAPKSPAIAAFPTGASPSGAANTCPLNDQAAAARPNAACTLGSIESPSVVSMMANGNVQFQMRLPGPPVAYLEVFARQNGAQNVSGDFSSSRVANPDGTFTYTKVVSGSGYHTGDTIDYRFYYYRTASTAVFLPGPSGTVWYPATTYRRPTDTPSQVTCKKANGDMQFSLTVNSRQTYVEAFVQQNGVQTGAGAITGSAVVNMNGTVTYTRTMAKSGFKSTDVIRSRYYHYETRSPGTFEPGPGEQVFYPNVTYGSAPACP